MDNIIQRLSRQPEGRPETFKKFNPNPPPEFPSYEQWVQQAQTAEKQEVQRPPEFPAYEDWQSQTTGGTLPSQFQMEAPTETGIPGLERFKPLMDMLGITTPEELVDVIGEATDKDLALIMKIAGVKEEKEALLSQYSDEELTSKYKIGEISTQDYEDELKSREAIGLITGGEPSPEDKAKSMIQAVADIAKYTEEGGDIHDLPLDYLTENNLLDNIPVQELINRGYFTTEMLEDVGNEIIGGTPDEELIEEIIESWNITRKLAELVILKAKEFTGGGQNINTTV